MKPRARFTPHLNTWAFWIFPWDWAVRKVGFGFTLDEARRDWQQQHEAQ